jgi:uncharacterized protein
MEWDRKNQSPDVIDRRGQGGGGGFAGAGVFGLLFGLVRSKWGWGGVLVLVGLVLAYNFLGSGLRSGISSDEGGKRTDDELGRFVGSVLDDTQGVWDKTQLPRGVPYRHAKLVLFTDQTQTGCGFGDAATGPFYCPADEKVYIDLGFYRELSARLGAPGDFAQAYVIAHEIGHHVQNLTGQSDKVHRAAKSEQKGADGLSVRLELQADCYAGIWAKSTNQRGLLEQGDIEEAMKAAEAIGDDRLQEQAGRRVSPESFSHGSSAQRVSWFRRGLESGSVDACDTFSVATP